MHFNYTKAEYLLLTETEKHFILKAFEDKTVSNLYQMRNSFFNAYVNANRKKGKKEIPLIQKRKMKKGNKEEGQSLINRVEALEKKNEKNKWVHTLYAQFNSKISK